MMFVVLSHSILGWSVIQQYVTDTMIMLKLASKISQRLEISVSVLKTLYQDSGTGVNNIIHG